MGIEGPFLRLLMTALYTGSAGLLSSSVGHDVSRALPQTHAKMTGSVLDGILSTPCLVGGLGFVSEAARRPLLLY